MRLAPLVLTICGGLLASAASIPPVVLKQFDVRVPMRDGVRLAANVFRPDVRARVPAILVRTPYNKGADLPPGYLPFVERGYAVVMQDVRGRFASEGVFRPLDQEPKDGYDTLDWITRQPWSDAKVGMVGGSYLGIVQWKAALMNHPALKAISPVVSGYDDYRDRFYSTGGALKLGHRLQWMRDNVRVRGYKAPEFERFVLHLPLRTADRFATGDTHEMFQKVLDHPSFDPYWQARSTRQRIQSIRVPVLAFGGWYDNFVQSDLEAFAALRAAGGMNRIVIGPWPHNMSLKFSGVDFGAESHAPVRSMQLEWFDHWLKSKDPGLESRPPARIFVMGINRWRDEREWPPARTRPTPFYLRSKGHANTLDGDGELDDKASKRSEPDGFVFDPARPVPTSGGAVCCNPKVFPWGPQDQRAIEQRQDVLVYTSDKLTRDVEVTGPVRVVLWVSTSAPDTDFTAKLVDVFPDGAARNLTDGILRLRYRESLEKPAPATPGEVYRIVVDAGVTSNVFLKGHRIRLEISSSNFPRFDRNPNTGRAIAEEIELRKAHQTVYHDRTRPSHLLLPVAPDLSSGQVQAARLSARIR